jgi:hypothetical protein
MRGVNARTVEKTYPPRVVVKFTDDVCVPGQGDIEKYLHEAAVGPVEIAGIMTFGADRQTAELLVSTGIAADHIAGTTADEIHETLANAVEAALAPVPVGYDHEAVDAEALIAAAKQA